MPADELTAAHYKALKTCVEVADPGREDDDEVVSSPAAIVALAQEALNIMLQHDPSLEHEDPIDQLSAQDRDLLMAYTDAAQKFYWESDQGSRAGADRLEKIYTDWLKLIVERLNR